MSDALSFSLKRESLPVVLEDENGGKANYTLREMDGALRSDYIRLFSKNVQVTTDGKTTMKDYSGLDAELVSRCLYDADNKRVTVSEVQKFPARVLDALNKKCQDICGLGAGGDDETKNE